MAPRRKNGPAAAGAGEMAAQVAESAKELAARVASPADDELIGAERGQLELDKLQAEVDSLKVSGERGQLELGKIEFEIESLNDSLLRERDLHSFRKVILVLLFILVVGWLGSVVAAVWLSGRFGNELYLAAKPTFVFKLSDPVLIAFISSTTVSVIGIFVIAAKWLFPASNSTGTSKKNT